VPQDEAETRVVVAVPRQSLSAARRAAAVEAVGPAPASRHTHRGTRKASGVIHRRPLVIIGRVTVRTPRPDVPVHIEKPPGVRRLETDRVGHSSGVFIGLIHEPAELAAGYLGRTEVKRLDDPHEVLLSSAGRIEDRLVTAVMAFSSDAVILE
jgi:hypothetical protein